MAIYRDLFFNNLRNLLGGMFPVIRKIVGRDKWRHLIREFMRFHRAETPYFLQLPREFLAFLQNEYRMQDDDYPFLLELAHYEYIEIALSISEEEDDLSGIDPKGDPVREVPVKSVLSWLYAYSFAVHRVSTSYLPTDAAEQPVFLAVYRDSADKVRFLELNPVTAGLLQAIESNAAGQTGEELLRGLAQTIGYADVDALIRHGAEALAEMMNLGILTGTRKPG